MKLKKRRDRRTFELTGKYASAVLLTDEVEKSAVEQIKTFCDQKFTKDYKIRIMPNVRLDKDGIIGFTADMGNKVIPNLVGTDIGCGILTVYLDDTATDLKKIDEIIKTSIPYGEAVHKTQKHSCLDLHQLKCYTHLKDTDRIERGVGTLGGGNHFIEVCMDNKFNRYLLVHTGSRDLGRQVSKFYQQLACDTLRDAHQSGHIPTELCYLTGGARNLYLTDMYLCQAYATENRRAIANTILKGLFGKTLADFLHFETVHNYISKIDNIVRKGAVSAHRGDRMVIPVNQHDGNIICRAFGNREWNFSAPHAAGPLYNRKKTDVLPNTYQSMERTLQHLFYTADFIATIVPTYHFKASE